MIYDHKIIKPSPCLDYIDWDACRKTDCHYVIAGAIVALIGIGLSTYAASEQASQQAKQVKYENQLRMRENELQTQEAAAARAEARQEAESMRQAAEYEEHQFRRRIRILKGKQTAELAALGLDTATGSPLFTQLDTTRQAEMEALNIRRTGLQSASAKEFEASLIRGRYLPTQSYYSSLGLTAGAGAAQAGSTLLRAYAIRGRGGSNGEDIVARPGHTDFSGQYGP